jgi:outer membrane protein assembly factor BamE
MYKYLKISALITICLIISACSGVSISQWRFPYMMEVQQGTYVTEGQYKQIKIGMTKDQVSYIIGKPLCQYMFDQNRWDFIYQDYKSNSLKKDYSLTVFFGRDNKVTNITKNGELFVK